MNSFGVGNVEQIVSHLELLGANVLEEKSIHMNYEGVGKDVLSIEIGDTEKYIQSESIQEVYVTDDAETLESLNNHGNNVANVEDYVFYVDKNGGVKHFQDTKNPHENIKVVNEKVNFDGCKPYMYSKANGKWKKQKVVLRDHDDNSPREADIVKPDKKGFEIQFVTDNYHNKKYTIDKDNGVVIRINMANETVSRKLCNSKPQDVSTKHMTRSGLVFLEGILTNALVDIIVDNDVSCGKLGAVKSGSVSCNKLLNHRTRIEGEIDLIIDDVFEKLLEKKAFDALDGVSDSTEALVSNINIALLSDDPSSNIKKLVNDTRKQMLNLLESY